MNWNRKNARKAITQLKSQLENTNKIIGSSIVAIFNEHYWMVALYTMKTKLPAWRITLYEKTMIKI